MTNQKTNWKFILIVLILATLVGGGILGYFEYFKREMISLTQFPEIKKPEKLTADWKIYRNEIYNFEIKYPENWLIREYSPEREENLPEGKRSIIISFASNQEDLIYERGVNIFVFPLNATSWELYIRAENIICKNEKLMNQNIKNLIQEGKIKNYCFTGEKLYFSTFSNTIFKFYSGVKGKEIFDQILSTFKLIEFAKEIPKFEYPKEWGSLTFQSQKGEVYIFKSESEKIETILYHKSSGIIVFVERGEKYKSLGGENYQKILKVIDQQKKIKTLYVISPNYVEWEGNIDKITISPNGKYVAFIFSAYEYCKPLMINIETGKNIFEGLPIWFSDPDESIFWSPNNKTLVIKSAVNELLGEGINGIFVSDFEKPDSLNEVFSFSVEEHLTGSYIYDLQFLDDNKLFFTVVLKKCKYEVEKKCEPEKTIKYEYIVQSKELKEQKRK